MKEEVLDSGIFSLEEAQTAFTQAWYPVSATWPQGTLRVEGWGTPRTRSRGTRSLRTQTMTPYRCAPYGGEDGEHRAGAATRH